MSRSRTIVITGVSRGLGRALVTGFSKQGNTVAGCARSQAGIAELSGRCPAPHHFCPVDITNETAVGKWCEYVIQNVGAPDILINNAAVINRNAELWKVPPAEFRQLVDVNICGIYNVLRHFLPPMIQRKSGIIANFSSTWGRTTSPEVAPYCASKWAVEGLTQSLAKELPHGLAAIAVNPGVINTDMLRSCFGDSAASYPDASEWAKRAVPFFLNLEAGQNGESVTVS